MFRRRASLGLLLDRCPVLLGREVGRYRGTRPFGLRVSIFSGLTGSPYTCLVPISAWKWRRVSKAIRSGGAFASEGVGRGKEVYSLTDFLVRDACHLFVFPFVSDAVGHCVAICPVFLFSASASSCSPPPGYLECSVVLNHGCAGLNSIERHVARRFIKVARIIYSWP